MKEKKLKLFVAIPVPENLKVDILKFIDVNSIVSNIRWIPNENWHVTLFFIGFIIESKLNLINEKLENLIKREASFKLFYDRFSLEGKPSKSSMIWCRFKANDPFAEISNKINNALSNELEQVQEFKRAIPHITLARLRKSVNRNEINLNFISETKEIEVVDCRLWQSIPTKSGMTYKNLFNYDFIK